MAGRLDGRRGAIQRGLALPYPDRDAGQIARYLRGIERYALALLQAGREPAEISRAVRARYSEKAVTAELMRVVRAMHRRQSKQFLAGLKAALGQLPKRKPPRQARRRDAPDGSAFSWRQVTAKVEPQQVPEISDAMLARWVSQAVEGVTSIRDDMLQTIRVDLAMALREGTTPQRLAEDWLARGVPVEHGTARGRLEFLAHNSLGTLHGRLARFRQQAAGIERYQWQTQGDDRVRPEHEEREGQIFDWSDPPSDGHPGDAPNCRCYAVAVFEPADVAEDLGDGPDDDLLDVMAAAE